MDDDDPTMNTTELHDGRPAVAAPAPGGSERLHDLLALLDAPHLEDRLAAIRALSETGDEEALRLLRARLSAVNKEFGALVVGVDKLKKRLR